MLLVVLIIVMLRFVVLLMSGRLFSENGLGGICDVWISMLSWCIFMCVCVWVILVIWVVVLGVVVSVLLGNVCMLNIWFIVNSVDCGMICLVCSVVLCVVKVCCV